MSTTTQNQNVPTPTIIKFSTNWNNKLSCNYFTTIRLASPKFQVGKRYIIELQGKGIKEVEMIDGKIITMAQINDFVSFLDTGYDTKNFYNLFCKMYPDVDWTTQRLVLCLFKTLPTSTTTAQANRNNNTNRQPQK